MKLPENIRQFFRKQGSIGAAKRQANLSPERRREIAKKAAETRWGKSQKKVGKAKDRKRSGGQK